MRQVEQQSNTLTFSLSFTVTESQSKDDGPRVHLMKPVLSLYWNCEGLRWIQPERNWRTGQYKALLFVLHSIHWVYVSVLNIVLYLYCKNCLSGNQAICPYELTSKLWFHSGYCRYRMESAWLLFLKNIAKSIIKNRMINNTILRIHFRRKLPNILEHIPWTNSFPVSIGLCEILESSLYCKKPSLSFLNFALFP